MADYFEIYDRIVLELKTLATILADHWESFLLLLIVYTVLIIVVCSFYIKAMQKKIADDKQTLDLREDALKTVGTALETKESVVNARTGNLEEREREINKVLEENKKLKEENKKLIKELSSAEYTLFLEYMKMGKKGNGPDGLNVLDMVPKNADAESLNSKKRQN